MIRGWCPTVHAPMPSGDGLLVRVKPFGGRLSAAAIAALAEAASACASGAIELTSRGNLQIRGVHDTAAFARAMVGAGLADADPDREARRNVVAIPPCDDSLVAAAEAALSATPGLPAKYCVAVHGADAFVDGIRIASLRHLPRTPGRFSPPAPAEVPGHLLYLPFGQTDARTLATLTRDVRTTPWRALLSPVPAPGFATEPGTIAACPGAPACRSGQAPARADAARLQAAGFAGLHVSGCDKGCACPRAATTLVGRDGRYDLVRHGRAGDRPDRTGLSLAEAMAAL